MATIKNEALGGTVEWTSDVTGVTAYRTDLARGITAAKVPYSGVVVNVTYTSPLSTVGGTYTNVTDTLTAAQ